jgi:hypothetical protein
VITISISHEAFAAIEAALPEGARGVPRPDGKGRLLLTMHRQTLDRLKALRRAGESYSDVILRIAKERLTQPGSPILN